MFPVIIFLLFSKWSSFLSLNMQIYSVKLFQVEMPDLETLDSIAEQNQCIDYFVTSQEITNDNRKLDQPTDLKASEVRHWDVLTVGGPTPHALDSSGTGRSLIRFEELAKLHLEVTKYLLKQDAEHGNVRDMYAGFGLCEQDFCRFVIFFLVTYIYFLTVSRSKSKNPDY